MAGDFLKDLMEKNGAAEVAPEGGDVDLLEPGSPYKAHARPANKPLYTLHVDLGAKGWVSFQYVQLDSHSEFTAGEHGQVIKLRFAGTKIWELTVTGLDLWRFYDLVGQHRMAWIRKADRGFAAVSDGGPVIFGVDIKPIEREVG